TVPSSLLQENDERDDRQPEHHKKEDLPEAVRAVALYFAGPRIDHHLVDLLIEAKGSQVDGQQDVLEGDIGIRRIDLVDPLFVAADVASNVSIDYPGHHLFGHFKPLGQLHLIALGFIA